jgi:hypothetical protein
MFAGTENQLTIALVTGTVSIVVAIIAAAVTLWNVSKTNANAFAIQDLKSAVDHDLEHLKAKLSHGQVISSTQWNAEFTAYQALWKSMVAVRIAAAKPVFKEAELAGMGIPDEYLALDQAAVRMKDTVDKLREVFNESNRAIHDHAPFYSAPIRVTASKVQELTLSLLMKFMEGLTESVKGNDVILSKEFRQDGINRYGEIAVGIDHVETLIRARLAEVQVLDH